MSNDIKKHFSPRLIDFVIIVGCKEPATPSQLMAKSIHTQQLQHEHYEKTLPPELKQQYNDFYNAQRTKMQSQAQSTTTQPQLPIAQLPELLRRYPLDDHSDFMLPQDVTYFCQPEGCSNINCSSQERANANRDTTSFIFSLTEKDSARVRYGICINFFRPIEKKYHHHNHTSEQKNVKRNSRSARVNENMNKNDESDEEASKNKNTKEEEPKKKKRTKKASDVKYTHTLTSLCIISHHPFFSMFRECLNILRRIIEACHARSLASKPGTPSSTNPPSSSTSSIASNASHRDTVWGILTGSSGSISTDQISSLIACEIREIETWILRLLSAPVPIPGKTKVIVSPLIQMRIFLFSFYLTSALPEKVGLNFLSNYFHLHLDTYHKNHVLNRIEIEFFFLFYFIHLLCSKIDILPNEPAMLFALPDHTRFSLVDFPLHLPLELLGVEICIKVFTLILLENKVLFQSSDYNALTMSIMAFVSMLYPLEYMFPVIPLLPRCMNETEQVKTK